MMMSIYDYYSFLLCKGIGPKDMTKERARKICIEVYEAQFGEKPQAFIDWLDGKTETKDDKAFGFFGTNKSIPSSGDGDSTKGNNRGKKSRNR
jgi:hypothetical protein